MFRHRRKLVCRGWIALNFIADKRKLSAGVPVQEVVYTGLPCLFLSALNFLFTALHLHHTGAVASDALLLSNIPSVDVCKLLHNVSPSCQLLTYTIGDVKMQASIVVTDSKSFIASPRFPALQVCLLI